MRRSPAASAVTTVVTRYGLALVPAPVTSDWLTGVNAVAGAMPDVALRSWSEKAGENSVPLAKTNVPQSPGVADDGKTSKRASPMWLTWQLSSLPTAMLVSGPPEAIVLNGTAACAGGATPASMRSAAMTPRARRRRRLLPGIVVLADIARIGAFRVGRQRWSLPAWTP